MWVIRIKQYFQVQDYALWEVINNGNSWVSVPQTAQKNGTSVIKMSVPVTTEEKTNKKNELKARSLLLMALPNEHQLTFSQYSDAKTMFAAIETRFRVWMNKADIETISIDDLYNNFKIIEQDVKKSVGASSGAQNLAFMTASSTSSTNDVNTANPTYKVSTANPNINIPCPQVSTTNFSDNTVYAFMVENPNGSNLLQKDLKQIHEDDLEAMDLKWQLSLLSMRAKRYFQRTGKKIFINANDTAGYDKSSIVFQLSQDGTLCQGNVEHQEQRESVFLAAMAEEQVQTNMALMAFSDSEAKAVNTARPKAVNTARPKAVNTARPHSAVVNAVRVNHANVVKASACFGIRDHKLNSASITLKKPQTLKHEADPPSSTELLENLMQDVGNGKPKSAADDQKHVEDGPYNESVEKDKSEDDSSPKEVNVVGQHVNTASPKDNTGRFKLNTVDPSVNTASFI
ncbi:hypothetical protein Tco_1229395 [Tanacetum coccineum]